MFVAGKERRRSIDDATKIPARRRRRSTALRAPATCCRGPSCAKTCCPVADCALLLPSVSTTRQAQSQEEQRRAALLAAKSHEAACALQQVGNRQLAKQAGAASRATSAARASWTRLLRLSRALSVVYPSCLRPCGRRLSPFLCLPAGGRRQHCREVKLHASGGALLSLKSGTSSAESSPPATSPGGCHTRSPSDGSSPGKAAWCDDQQAASGECRHLGFC